MSRLRALACGATVTVVLVLGAAACGDDRKPDQEAFCTELRQSIDQNITVFDPQDPADPDEAVATLRMLADLAPDDIRPDVVVLRDAFVALADAIAELDLDDPDAAAELADVELDEARIAEAQTAMAAYGRDPCRIPLLNGPDSVTTTVPVTTVPAPTVPATTVAPG